MTKENKKTLRKRKDYTKSIKRTKKVKLIKVDDITYPKILIDGSCDAYSLQGNQIKYLKNGIEFCRTSKSTKSISNQYDTITHKKDILEFCNLLSPSDKSFLSKLFLIEEEDLCGTLKKWSLISQLKIKQVHFVASKFKVKSYLKLDKRKLIENISKYLKPKLTPLFHSLITKVNIEDEQQWLVYLLHKILLPEGFKENSELQISDDLYNEYLLLLQMEKDENIKDFFKETQERKTKFEFITDIEADILREALIIKFCSCISKFVFQNKLLNVLKDNEKDIIRYNPIAICRKSVLENRKTKNRKTKFVIPFEPHIIKNCHQKVILELK